MCAAIRASIVLKLIDYFDRCFFFSGLNSLRG